MYRQLLKTYVVRSEQLELNKVHEDERWCNFLCQQYLTTDKFYNKFSGQNMCKICNNKLVTAKKYIKEGRITKEQFKENPEIINDLKKKLTTDEVLECVECKEIKNLFDFDINRNICKLCRLNQANYRILKRIENDIHNLEENKNNEDNLKNILKRIPVDVISSILKHYKITRKSTDKKDDIIFKVMNYFRCLQDTYKCIGNCGFTLEEEFSSCNACKINKKISVEEKNHMFKENLPMFMDGIFELTDEDLYKYNDFCIRAIGEYLGIVLFRTKAKGDTKEKMVKIINEKLKENKQKETKVEEKSPTLELNGIIMLCREDGYVNATSLCKAGGKLFSKWYRLDSTKELLNVLKSQCPDKLIDSKVGGNHSGSWIHPFLATNLSQWISCDFSIKVSKWIEDWKKIKEENKEEYYNSILQIIPNNNKEEKEKKIQLRLQTELGGQIEIETDFGFIDLLTHNEIIEIKCGKKWKHGLGQLCAYGEFYKDHSKRLHLFDFNYDEKINKLCEKFNIKVSYE
jgi:hypothetical protein